MKKSDLITALSTEKKLQVKDAEKIVSIIIDEITQALLLGRRAEFRGFGVFSAKARSARVGRNPKSGIEINIEKKLIPHFRMSKNFYDKIN